MRDPMVGAERVAKALIGWGRRRASSGSSTGTALVNGDPASSTTAKTGTRAGWRRLEVAEGVVVAVRSMLNPDKLAHLRAVQR